MKLARGVVLFGLFVLFAGCGQRTAIGKLSESSVVVAFGDSLTAGAGAGPSESYPSVLEGLIGCRVVNAGVSGEESDEGLRRFPEVLRKESPDLVILCEGGNDMLRKKEDGAIIQNLDAMVSMARNAGADVVLIGVPRMGLRVQAPAFYQQIADQNKIPCDTETLADILSTPALKSDAIHPNAAGYKQLAEAVAKLLQKSQRE